VCLAGKKNESKKKRRKGNKKRKENLKNCSCPERPPVFREKNKTESREKKENP
jgi:hypothetical protein